MSDIDLSKITPDEPGDDTAPATFDLDAWINGSKPTERSVTLVGRGDLVAEAEAVLRRYEIAKQIPEGDRGINDDTPDALAARLEQLHAELESSRVTVYLHALRPEEIDAARKAAEDTKRDDGDPEYMAHMISAAVSRVVLASGAVAGSISAQQVLRLRDRLGYAQLMRLIDTMNLAASEEPQIQAPFSRTSSEGPAGGE